MNLLDLIFPNALYCVSCGRPLPVPEKDGFALCERCSGEIVWITGRRCEKCGRPLADENSAKLCRNCADTTNQPFTKGFACALYSGRAAEIVRDMKYRDRAWYADTIAALMAERLYAEADPGTGELPVYDCIVNVPMAPKKKTSRGYDQAELIAKGLSRRTGIQYLSKALFRVRETGIMSSLSGEERRQNLEGAFSVCCDMIKNKRILLTDDVFTTGSSSSACAETLLAAGASRVDVIVFAIGADSRRHEAYAADQGAPERSDASVLEVRARGE